MVVAGVVPGADCLLVPEESYTVGNTTGTGTWKLTVTRAVVRDSISLSLSFMNILGNSLGARQ